MSSSPIQIAFFLAFGLYFLLSGVTGLLTRQPRVARHRLPIVLIFILGSTTLRDVVDFTTYHINFSSLGVLLLFLPVSAALYVLSQSYMVTGITEGQLREALLATLATLGIQTEPASRDIVLPALNASIAIKPRHWLGEVEISIDRRDGRPLFNRIANTLDQYFKQANIRARVRAYVIDLLIAAVIFAVAGILAYR